MKHKTFSSYVENTNKEKISYENYMQNLYEQINKKTKQNIIKLIKKEKN